MTGRDRWTGPPAPPGTVRLPDNGRYIGRFEFESRSSNAKYLISLDTLIGAWVCSCPAGIHRGTCKHLTKLYPRRPTRAEVEAELKAETAAQKRSAEIRRAVEEEADRRRCILTPLRKEARQQFKGRLTRPAAPPPQPAPPAGRRLREDDEV